MGLMSLTLREGAYKLACLHHVPPGPSPMPLAVLFCNGLKSDLASRKVQHLYSLAQRAQQPSRGGDLPSGGGGGGFEFAAFDYEGQGRSEGAFLAAGLSEWLANALGVMEQCVAARRVVVVGSSIGGWVALRLAQDRPARVAGLVLVAPAPDMSELHWAALSDAERRAVLAGGSTSLHSPYALQGGDHVAAPFFAQGRQQLLYHPEARSVPLGAEAEGQRAHDNDPRAMCVGGGKPVGSGCAPVSSSADDAAAAVALAGVGRVQVCCPVHILHGSADEVVPLSHAQRLHAALDCGQFGKRLTVVEGGDHRLSDPPALRLLEEAVLAMLAAAAVPGERPESLRGEGGLQPR